MRFIPTRIELRSFEFLTIMERPGYFPDKLDLENVLRLIGKLNFTSNWSRIIGTEYHRRDPNVAENSITQVRASSRKLCVCFLERVSVSSPVPKIYVFLFEWLKNEMSKIYEQKHTFSHIYSWEEAWKRSIRTIAINKIMQRVSM